MTNKLLTWRQRGELWLRLSIRLALAALAVWTALRFGRPLFALSAPFVFALIAAAMLNPLVKRLQRALGWNRVRAGDIYDFNAGSRRLFTSLGFREEARTEKGFPWHIMETKRAGKTPKATISFKESI